jgi:DNA-binding transcriptional LysR family regulator
MTLGQLRNFVAVAERQHVTQAARIELAQSAAIAAQAADAVTQGRPTSAL